MVGPFTTPCVDDHQLNHEDVDEVGEFGTCCVPRELLSMKPECGCWHMTENTGHATRKMSTSMFYFVAGDNPQGCKMDGGALSFVCYVFQSPSRRVCAVSGSDHSVDILSVTFVLFAEVRSFGRSLALSFVGSQVRGFVGWCVWKGGRESGQTIRRKEQKRHSQKLSGLSSLFPSKHVNQRTSEPANEPTNQPTNLPSPLLSLPPCIPSFPSLPLPNTHTHPDTDTDTQRHRDQHRPHPRARACTRAREHARTRTHTRLHTAPSFLSPSTTTHLHPRA